MVKSYPDKAIPWLPSVSVYVERNGKVADSIALAVVGLFFMNGLFLYLAPFKFESCRIFNV